MVPLSSPEAATSTRAVGRPDELPAASTFLTTSMPSRTRPKTTCLPSSHGVSAVVMKNWLPFVFGPAFAIDSVPGPPCLMEKFSSANLEP